VVEPAEPPAAKSPEPTPTADLATSGSLLDIAAPEQEPAAEAQSPVVEPVETPAAKAPEPTPAADDEEPEPEPEAKDDEAEPQEKPKPASSGEANQPKTDVDISGSGSLFDL
jgi:hypothetical protein